MESTSSSSSSAGMPPGGGGVELPPGENEPEGPGGPPDYDANGNLKSYNGWTYTYDAQNRLRTARNNGTLIATYYYDGKNRQIARRLNDEIRFSVWDGWELIEEYGSNRAVAYLQGATGVIKSWGTNGTIYYYQDKLGSTTHVANASGALLETFHYDLYGKPSEVSAYGIVDLYAGERWTGVLGLYDLRNRFMSPELGRFLQSDPIGSKGDASNLYRYCGNDSVNKSDPMGLAPIYVPDDVDFYARSAALKAQELYNNATTLKDMERNVAVFRDGRGSLTLSDPTVGWRDKSSGKLRSAPADPPRGSTRPASGHNHPNGTQISWEDRVAGDLRGEAVYARGDYTERWRPDELKWKRLRHLGGVRERWSERANKWIRQTTPQIPTNADLSRSGSGTGEFGAMATSESDIRSFNNQLVIDLVNANNSGEGVHPRGPR